MPRIRKSLVTPSEGKALQSAMSGMRRLVGARLDKSDLAGLRSHVRVDARGRTRNLTDDELVDLVAAHILLRPALVATLGGAPSQNPRWQALEAAAAKVSARAYVPAEESTR